MNPTEPTPLPAQALDTRLWKYRAAPDHPGEYEARLFARPSAVPAGEVWFDSPGEAECGVALKPGEGQAERPFDELSVADQVAALEAAGGSPAGDDEAGLSPAEAETIGKAIAKIEAEPAKRGRKAKGA